MNESQAQTAITLSALVVGGMYGIRKLTEPEVKDVKPGVLYDYKSVFGTAPPISWGQFLKASGFLFVSLAVVGAASPEIAGGFAVLIGTAAVLGNLIAVRHDLIQEQGAPSAAQRFESVTQTGR